MCGRDPKLFFKFGSAGGRRCLLLLGKINQKVPPLLRKQKQSDLLKIIPDLDTLPETSIPEFCTPQKKKF
jgi:hypothetical protein